MTDRLVSFRVSGKAMSTIEGSELYQRPEMYDGGTAEARAAHEALNTCQARRAGKGWTHVVTTTVEAAELIEDYCRTVGETFAGESEPETRADGRALLTVADKIRALLKVVAVEAEAQDFADRFPLTDALASQGVLTND